MQPPPTWDVRQPSYDNPKWGGELLNPLPPWEAINFMAQPTTKSDTTTPSMQQEPPWENETLSEDKEQFAFSVVFPNGQHPNLRFQWKVLPQGIVNSPTICQITVDQVLAPIWYAEPTATIIQYMDDILIAAPSTSQVDRLINNNLPDLESKRIRNRKCKNKERTLCDLFGSPDHQLLCDSSANQDPLRHQNTPRHAATGRILAVDLKYHPDPTRNHVSAV
ncbi:hypothetical protein HGM15179_012466 [Zosterops borbonicus]|uniref:ribonuclease H n=1 Tax=Zosterops borbonicus TaxID=364589 RepID=A0A8K1LIA2_9PASS|nr:hypothetical protein HGM15179_012466 [Zosterops borbonicus]